MRTLRARLVAAVGLIAGGAAVSAVVLTCNAVNANGSPDWTVVPGLALLILGPVGGVAVGLVMALRAGGKPPT